MSDVTVELTTDDPAVAQEVADFVESALMESQLGDFLLSVRRENPS
jgi:hypothetical protein